MQFDRRAFLRLAAVAPFAGSLFARESHLLQMNGYPANLETPLELLTDYLTPNELFFVRSHWIPRMPDVKTWRLVVDGEVRTPLTLSLADLKKMPRAEATCVLQCAGNGRALQKPTVPGVQWNYGAVGNARWSGVRLRDVLVRAGVRRPAAKHLHLFGSDDPPGKVPPFHRSIELEKAMDDCILAYEMNGRPLPPQHGAPLRMVVPGWAGDHWMKWVVRLTASAVPQTGFYMDTGYRWPNTPGAPGVTFKPEEMHPLTEIAVKSNITTAPQKMRVGQTTEIRGFAFSGASDIAKVEVSDDGKTFRPATLDARHAPHAWRLWSYRWKPTRAGSHQLTVRATDNRGATQPRETIWNQSGYLYNAWHSATVEVTK